MTSLFLLKKFNFFLNSHAVRFCKYTLLNEIKVNHVPRMTKMLNFHTCPVLCSDDVSEESQTSEGEKETTKQLNIDPSKDRTKVIPPEVSIRYMKSEAYKATYGDEPVWVKYRRNFKGRFTPRNSRKTCIRGGVISTGNPCPICRDEYLVLHYTNVDLLKQFIRPETGEIYSTQKIHVCQKRLLQLEVAVKKAKSYGLLTHEVPFRKFNYSEYYPKKSV